jgi:hypothetical protein
VIEMGKEYRTREGREVVILATNGRGLYSVVGQTNDGVDWVHENWTADGTVFIDRRCSPGDLIEVKPVQVFERWVNIHHDGSSSSYRKREDADAFATEMGRIACLHIRQEYREGDGLCDSEKT